MTPDIKQRLEKICEAKRLEGYPDSLCSGDVHGLFFMAGAEAGYKLGVEAERERCVQIALDVARSFSKGGFNELGFQIGQKILDPKEGAE